MKTMRETDETPAIHSAKQKIGKAAAEFFAVMLLLAFLSNTINHLSLPRVTTEWPSRGSIIKQIKMEGKIEAKKTYHCYIPASMQVAEVKIRLGDTVKKGQRLMMLDSSGLEKQLLDETDSLEQKKIELALRRMKSDVNLAGYDEAITRAQIQLERARADYERIRNLVELGIETRENLQNASRKVDDCEREYAKAIDDRGKALLSGQAEAEKNELEIQNLIYDIAIQERQIEQLKNQLKACEITAPFNGVISAVNFREGETAGTNQPLYSLMDISGGYCFKGVLDKDFAADIKPGDEAEIIFNGYEWQPITGTVSDIRDSSDYPGERLEVELEIDMKSFSGEWSQGQRGTAKLEKRTAVYEYLVSNSAIGRDNEGYFVYVPEVKKGYLGNEIYARMVRVTIGESDEQKTAVVQGISREDRVIGSSDKPLSDGMRIWWEQ